MKTFVTGGAGFVGSHIVDLKKLIKEMKGSDMVFHFAAHADVRSGFINHQIDFEQNLLGTINVLEAMYKNNIKKIAFPSTSSVYGDATIIPTPENYPFSPTSLYGSSKAAAETYISTFCEYYDMTAYIFRFVSWVGERYTHGLVFDFLNKLEKDPVTLHILGDCRQKKSYLYVKDGVDAIFTIIEKAKDRVNIYNLGNDEIINVADSAKVIIDEAKYKNVKFVYEGGDKGWIGDSNYVFLDTK